MNKILIATLTTVFIIACGNSDSAKEESDHFNNKVIPPDSVTEIKAEEKIPVENKETSGGSSSFTDNTSEILSHIDNYLVSSTELSLLNIGDGFTEAVVSVKNKLSDITIQKALLEVSILTVDNKEYRTDYFTLQNIEPGDIKSVKIPKSSRGVKLGCHIVKLKSDVLTNGEMILVGSKYSNK